MNIEINGLAAQVIRDALATGSFNTAEEVVAAMAKDWKEHHAEAQRRLNGKKPISAYEEFASRGIIGCMKDGPSDLATNPSHMEGFGQ